MNSRASIVNISGDFEESIIQLARHLGTSQLRRKLFRAVYGRGEKPKSKKQLMAIAGIKDKGTNAQQAQNELDHLAKHHLVAKARSEKRLEDGSRNLYSKDATIRANKDRIIYYADNPSRAEKVATKRRPAIARDISTKVVTRSTLRRRKPLVVLYLASSPEPDAPLRIDVEVRRVQQAIRASKFRDNVKIEYRPAADLTSLIDGLNDLSPTVVHFSGHSDTLGIVGDNQSVKHPKGSDISYEIFGKALRATDRPPTVVVLNSCESISSQSSILDAVGIVIGMNAPISDIAAATFAPQFYAALASGQSVRSAFEQAKLMVETISLSEEQTVEMVHTSNVDPGKVILT